MKPLSHFCWDDLTYQPNCKEHYGEVSLGYSAGGADQRLHDNDNTLRFATEHGGLSIGMTQDDVVSVLGKPAKVAVQGRIAYMEYGWDNPFDGKIGAAEHYFVRLVDGRVESYGQKGDFDSTKNPTVNVNITHKDLDAKPDPIRRDIYVELPKLKALLDSGAITQQEYETQKAKLLANQ